MFGVIFGIFVGFIIFMLATHPSSKVNKKFSEKKIKNLQFFPRVSVSAKNRVYHVHHWMFLTPLLLVIQNFQSNILHGFVIGGILQGLMFKDRFRFIFKHDEYHAKIKTSSVVHVPLIKHLKKFIK